MCVLNTSGACRQARTHLMSTLNTYTINSFTEAIRLESLVSRVTDPDSPRENEPPPPPDPLPPVTRDAYEGLSEPLVEPLRGRGFAQSSRGVLAVNFALPSAFNGRGVSEELGKGLQLFLQACAGRGDLRRGSASRRHVFSYVYSARLP